jgi:hypothetical protein
MKFVFAVIASYGDMSKVLTSQNVENRLVSYYLLKDLPDEYLRYYSSTGLTFHKKDKKLKNTMWKHTRYIRERRIFLCERNQVYKNLENTVE